MGAPSPGQATRFAEALATLGSPTRLAILRALREPKTVTEIDVRVPGLPGAPPRPIARQTVREHLDRLVEMGVVVLQEGERPQGPAVEYVLNHQALFALAEEFQDLARLRPTAEPRGPTIGGLQPAEDFELAGPCLVLVRGLDDGRLFPLARPPKGRREWILGRSRGADVSLDFDPYISSENALVWYEEGTFFLRDLDESRNGTTVNYQLLPKTARRTLRTGDLIGMGRTMLMFRA